MLPQVPSGELLRKVLDAKGGSIPVLDSMNHFYSERLKVILGSLDVVSSTGVHFKFINPKFIRPEIQDMHGNRPLYPAEARRAKLSYMAKMYATLQNQSDPSDFTQVLVGKIPVMIGSELCHTYGLTPTEKYRLGEPMRDAPGYFINKGMEKVFLTIDKLRTKIDLMYEDKGKYLVRYTSETITDTTVVIIRENGFTIDVFFDKIEAKENGVNIFYVFHLLGFMEQTVERTLNEMYNFIVDSDPKRELKRRQDFLYYIMPTIKAYQSKTNGDTRKVADEVLKVHRDIAVTGSENRYDAIIKAIEQDVFKNIPINLSERPEVINARRLEKIRLLSHMVVKFVEFRNGYRDIDNRDFWGNKRLDDAAKHISQTFVKIWRGMIMDLNKTVNHYTGIHTTAQVKKHIKPNEMEKQFLSAFSKELLGIGPRGKKDVVKVDTLKRDTLLAAISHIRRINTPTSRRAKNRDKRLTNNTCWGVVCNTSTSEGENCGLIKEAALTIFVSLQRNENLVRTRIYRYYTTNPISDLIPFFIDDKVVGYTLPAAFQPQIDEGRVRFTGTELHGEEGFELSEQMLLSLTMYANNRNPLFLNGVCIGFTDVHKLREHLYTLRRTNQAIPFDTGIVLNQYNELYILTDDGRVCRPMLIVNPSTQVLLIDEKNMRNSTLTELMNSGVLEYIDVSEQEQENILIAQSYKHLVDDVRRVNNTIAESKRILEDPAYSKDDKISARRALLELKKEQRYTHCEIDPTAIMGISASIIPFAEFTPAPRLTYQSGMGKQALGPNSSRIELRFDTTMKTIIQPGVPTVATDTHDWLGLDDFPASNQLIVAIMTYGGGNQEDAILVNQTAIDMGFSAMMIYHSYETKVCKQKGHTRDEIRIPDYTPDKEHLYSKLDPTTGIIRVNEVVNEGDCIIGKITIDTSTTPHRIRNTSVFAEVGKEGRVDEVLVVPTLDSCEVVRIRLREYRKPKAGDKFSSRYSQKGVIGQVIPEEDMPWIESDNPAMNGVRPHILFNPHGIPSRMTIGKLVELIVSLYAIILGIRINATAFRGFSVRELLDILEKLGLPRNGKFKMRNGRTGLSIESDIYVGVVAYQALRHLVDDKMRARGVGAIQATSRQPVQGIRKEGGLRLGEMERDGLIQHGASQLLKERMSVSSDEWSEIVCDVCGSPGVHLIELAEFRCTSCRSDSFSMIKIPYATKLFFQLNMGLGIATRFHLRHDKQLY